RRLLRGIQPRAADRRHSAALQRVVRTHLPAQCPGGHLRRVRAGCYAPARRRSRQCRGPTGPRRGSLGEVRHVSAADLPLREELRGIQPYGAPQLDVAVRLNVNENPYPPPAEVVSGAATAVADTVSGLNRYPDRDARELRGDLAGYLAQESGVP